MRHLQVYGCVVRFDDAFLAWVQILRARALNDLPMRIGDPFQSARAPSRLSVPTAHLTLNPPAFSISFCTLHRFSFCFVARRLIRYISDSLNILRSHFLRCHFTVWHLRSFLHFTITAFICSRLFSLHHSHHSCVVADLFFRRTSPFHSSLRFHRRPFHFSHLYFLSF